MAVDDRPVNVLVCTSLPDELLARIVAVDERAKVHDAAAQLLEELPSALRPGQTPAPLREPGSSLNDLLAEAEVLLSARRLPAALGRTQLRVCPQEQCRRIEQRQALFCSQCGARMTDAPRDGSL